MRTTQHITVPARKTVALPSAFDAAMADTPLHAVGKRAREALSIWHNPTDRAIELDITEGHEVEVSPA